MSTQSDVLKVEGIYKNGYGIVPKFVMHDPDLTLESKAIYAYLCALSGGGDTTFPYRETILKQLKLAKNTYYNHYTPLIEQGYLRVERPEDKTAANIYTIVANPKKLVEVDAGTGDTIRYKGLKSHGYGSIPRAVMQDSRLSIKAKGLYAYFCSYCGAGNCAFPNKNNILFHLGISEPTYYKALNLLKQFGFISVCQRKVSGMFSVNDYYLNEFPDDAGSDIPPNTNNCDTINKDIKTCSINNNVDATANDSLPNTSFCDTTICDNKNSDAAFEDTNIGDANIITKKSINSRLINNPSIGYTRKDLEDAARKYLEGLIDRYEIDGVLMEFMPRFIASARSKKVRSVPAYLKKSLDNFVENRHARASQTYGRANGMFYSQSSGQAYQRYQGTRSYTDADIMKVVELSMTEGWN